MKPMTEAEARAIARSYLRQMPRIRAIRVGYCPTPDYPGGISSEMRVGTHVAAHVHHDGPEERSVCIANAVLLTDPVMRHEYAHIVSGEGDDQPAFRAVLAMLDAPMQVSRVHVRYGNAHRHIRFVETWA